MTTLLVQWIIRKCNTGKNTKTVRLPSRAKAIRVYAVKDARFSWE